MILPDPTDNPHFYEHLLAKRFLAWVIDLVVTAILAAVPVVLSAGLALILVPLIWPSIAIAYRTTMLRRYSATLGMMIAATELRHLDGRRPAPQIALWHSILYTFSMVFILPQIGSIALMLNTPHRQGLNDWILGTTILNRYSLS